MIHNNLAYCPYCEEVLTPETIDHECTGEWCTAIKYGACSKCQRVYGWKEWYKLHRLDNFQEITEDMCYIG